jgi:hypothetical protein
MAKKIFIRLLILSLIGLVIFIGYVLIVVFAFGGLDKDYSVTELKENFESKRVEIYELKKYFNEIVPNNRLVQIEFDNDNTLSVFFIKALDKREGEPDEPMFLEWDLKTNTQRMDRIIKPLGWTRETLKKLKDKLGDANCIGIESGEPTKIEFQRSGMGMYSFNVFDKPISDKEKTQYNDSCTYILANDNLILEYGGGAIGSQCFYNKK